MPTTAAIMGQARLVPPTREYPPCNETRTSTPLFGSASMEMSGTARLWQIVATSGFWKASEGVYALQPPPEPLQPVSTTGNVTRKGLVAAIPSVVPPTRSEEHTS